MDPAPSGDREREPDPQARKLGPGELADELSDLARQLQRLSDPSEVLAEMVTAAIALIPGVEEGSITDVIARHRIEHKAASSDLPKRVDKLMTAVGEGPCLDAIWDQKMVRVDDLASEQRWPAFSARAAELGARSMLSFQLYVEGDNLGALNLYSSRPRAFGEDSEHVGKLFAAHAAVAYAGAQHAEQLESALETRGAIGEAVGILMERYQLGADRAFAVLVRFSQQSNRKLRDIADEIVRDAESGRLH
ncbi:GAF and ANTAR domain-containing protein [Kribbella sp. CA-247076]|uniref:GAF and ANTAR domain-containing protein n=1 Tax=Kribbella sp. CA-247076 TaxID=3239941 RepID=UPI003D8DDA43